MAAQPITSAHKRPHRFFSIDVGALLMAASLVCHWHAHVTVALLCGLAGLVTAAVGGYQAMRQSGRRPATVPVATEASADARVSRPQRP